MMLEQLRNQTEYVIWSMGRTIELLETLSHEQFTRPMPDGAESVRDKLVHTIDGVAVWAARCEAALESGIRSAESFGNLAVTIGYWKTESQRLAQLMEGMTEEELAEQRGYPDQDQQSGPHSVAEVLFHVLDHCTYHRAQVMAFLRAVGGEPVSTTYRWYLKEHRPYAQ